jgi:hypothetical protein
MRNIAQYFFFNITKCYASIRKGGDDGEDYSRTSADPGRSLLNTERGVNTQYLIPNPDKPERRATKAPRHKSLFLIKLRVLAS